MEEAIVKVGDLYSYSSGGRNDSWVGLCMVVGITPDRKGYIVTFFKLTTRDGHNTLNSNHLRVWTPLNPEDYTKLTT